MWQELDDAAGLVRGQSREHVLEVGIRVVPVHTGRLDGPVGAICARRWR